MNAEIVDIIDVHIDDLQELQVNMDMPEPLSLTMDLDNSLPSQEKSITIAQNGSYAITPDPAYTLKKVDVEVAVKEKVSGFTALSFRGVTDTYIDASKFDVSRVTQASEMFMRCEKAETIDITGWDTSNFNYIAFNFDSKLRRIIGHEDIDTSKWTECANFYLCHAIEWLDCSKWDYTNVKSISQNSFMMSGIKTFIGDHTLKEVEDGEIVAFKGWGTNYYRLQISSWYVRDLRFSSLLAVLKGMADRTGMEQAGSFEIGNTSRLFGRLKNDNDTIPDATTLAERQATVRAICAEKNYNLVLA